MTVTPDTFRRHLAILGEYFEFVSLSAWLERRQRGDALPRMACAITFDDGWADNHEFAFPVLRERDVPATIFLVAEKIGTRGKFWPERLARLLVAAGTAPGEDRAAPELQWLDRLRAAAGITGATPDRGALSQAIAAAKPFADSEIERHLDVLEQYPGTAAGNEPPSLLDWEQVNEMLASGLVEAGSHTCNHVRLNARLAPERLEREIVYSGELIKAHTDRDAVTFCFPNGDTSPRATELVRQHYSGAVTTRCGWNSAATDAHLLNRIGVHEDISADRVSLLARISGWF